MTYEAAETSAVFSRNTSGIRLYCHTGKRTKNKILLTNATSRLTFLNVNNRYIQYAVTDAANDDISATRHGMVPNGIWRSMFAISEKSGYPGG